MSRRRRKKLAHVGGLVDDVLDRIGIRERVEKSATAARWEDVVGPHIASVTKAGSIRKDGTMFVEVAGAAWMTELNMMRRTLLGRLNEDRTRGRIERLVFVQSDDGETASYRRGRNLKGRG
ncbi:MAG: DUF721 domain-containing protein [Gemmatimonadetes bacterium]|nr:DUF721 domain-containing protein [Gemmatimonadota bacterium]